MASAFSPSPREEAILPQSPSNNPLSFSATVLAPSADPSLPQDLVLELHEHPVPRTAVRGSFVCSRCKELRYDRAHKCRICAAATSTTDATANQPTASPKAKKRTHSTIDHMSPSALKRRAGAAPDGAPPSPGSSVVAPPPSAPFSSGGPIFCVQCFKSLKAFQDECLRHALELEAKARLEAEELQYHRRREGLLTTSTVGVPASTTAKSDNVETMSRQSQETDGLDPLDATIGGNATTTTGLPQQQQQQQTPADPTGLSTSVGKGGSAEGDALHQMLEGCVTGDYLCVKDILDATEFLHNLDLEGTQAHGPHSGRSALLLAAQHGHKSIVVLLVSRQAQRDTIDNLGMTPLMHAAYNGHVEVVDELLFAGVGVDRVAFSGYTAMLLACCRGHSTAARRLLAAGASPAARNPLGRNGLIVAAFNGHLEVVKVLLETIAEEDLDLETTDNEGYTALDAAICMNHSAVEKLLLAEMEQRRAQSLLSSAAASAAASKLLHGDGGPSRSNRNLKRLLKEQKEEFEMQQRFATTAKAEAEQKPDEATATEFEDERREEDETQ